MKKNLHLAVLLFISNICVSQNTNSLFVDCGGSLVYCSNLYGYNNGMNIGDSVVVKNGKEPYAYEWNVKDQSSTIMFDDSHSVNPKISYASYDASIYTLYLTVTDALGQTATDSLIVYFSGNNDDGFVPNLKFGMDLGDSLSLNNSLLLIDTLFCAKTFLISETDTLQMPCTIRPNENGTYKYYSVDTLGCVGSIKHFDVNLNYDVPQNYDYFPLVHKGAEWCQAYYFDEFVALEKGARCQLEHYKISDTDTVINGKSYFKLYYYTDESVTNAYDNCIGGIRETGKQVFFVPFLSFSKFPSWNYNYIDTTYSECLIYDFNTGSVVANRAVEEVGYEVFGNETRKVYKIGWKNVVEGIGCLQGFLDAYAETVTGFTYSELVYYKFGSNQIFLNNYTTRSPYCSFDDIQTQNIDEPRIIYSNNSLIIESEYTEFQLSIVDMQGRTQLQETVYAGESVDCQCLSAGLYLVAVQTQEGEVVAVERIVKQ